MGWGGVALRIAAAIVVPLWAARLAGPPPDRVPDLPALLVFAVSTAALGLVILTVYDTALLYNLGHLGARRPVTAAALAVLWVVWRGSGRLSESAVGAAGIYLAFFVFNKGAFLNYYWFTDALLAMAIPLLAAEPGVTADHEHGPNRSRARK